MTRKRFKKLLMANGYSRNRAEARARASGFSYAAEYYFTTYGLEWFECLKERAIQLACDAIVCGEGQQMGGFVTIDNPDDLQPYDIRDDIIEKEKTND